MLKFPLSLRAYVCKCVAIYYHPVCSFGTATPPREGNFYSLVPLLWRGGFALAKSGWLIGIHQLLYIYNYLFIHFQLFNLLIAQTFYCISNHLRIFTKFLTKRLKITLCRLRNNISIISYKLNLLNI